MEHESNSDSYVGEVEDISVDESSSDTSTSEVEITDSDLGSSTDIQTLQ
jgi:sporulation protein YlmC with PRC-barrel domain